MMSPSENFTGWTAGTKRFGCDMPDDAPWGGRPAWMLKPKRSVMTGDVLAESRG